MLSCFGCFIVCARLLGLVCGLWFGLCCGHVNSVGFVIGCVRFCFICGLQMLPGLGLLIGCMVWLLCFSSLRLYWFGVWCLFSWWFGLLFVLLAYACVLGLFGVFLSSLVVVYGGVVAFWVFAF